MKVFSLILFALIGSATVTPLFGAGGAQQERAVTCPECHKPYTHQSIVIQLKCSSQTNHHMCLDCLAEKAQENSNRCPVCNDQTYELFDPLVFGDTDYSVVHHYFFKRGNTYTVLRPDKNAINNIRSKVPLTQEPYPDTPIRLCPGCPNPVPVDTLYIPFTCSHGACLEHAHAYIQGNQGCPTCNNDQPLEIADPLKKSARGVPVLIYMQRQCTLRELEQLAFIRTTFADKVCQRHIRPDERIATDAELATPACALCEQPIEQNSAIIDFSSCNHSIDLECMARWVLVGIQANGTFACPQCPDQELTIHDPIQHRNADDNTIVFCATDRVPTEAEQRYLDAIRICPQLNILHHDDATLHVARPQAPVVEPVDDVRPPIEPVVERLINDEPEQNNEAIILLINNQFIQEFDFEDAEDLIARVGADLRSENYETLQEEPPLFRYQFQGQSIEGTGYTDIMRKVLQRAQAQNEPALVDAQRAPAAVAIDEQDEELKLKKSNFSAVGDFLTGLVFGALIAPELSNQEETNNKKIIRRGALLPATVGTYLLTQKVASPQKGPAKLTGSSVLLVASSCKNI